MVLTIKRLLLRVLKLCGLFHVSRLLFRQHLRILCYHGVALGDEFKVYPKLFMTAAAFERRMRYLKRAGFEFVSLDRAVEHLRSGSMPRDAVVVTMDDGWAGTYAKAKPILQRLNIPATVYVSTYYAQSQQTVFNVFVRYLATVRRKERFMLRGGDYSTDAILELGEKLDLPQRKLLERDVAASCGLDIEQIYQTRQFQLMTMDEISQSAASGLDIQLHTHRHRWGRDPALMEKEIADNRKALRSVVSTPLEHFCYPSGNHAPDDWPKLASLGIKSATTLEPGLNGPHAPLLALHRIVDGENVSQIEFEAEISGFMSIARRGAELFGRRPKQVVRKAYRAVPAQPPVTT